MVWGGLAVVQPVFVGRTIGEVDHRMDQRGNEPTPTDLMKRLPARLWEVRWPLAAAAVAFPVATAIGGGSMPLALGAVAVMLIAAALAPLGGTAALRDSEARPRRGTGIASLEPAALAAAVPEPLIFFDYSGAVVDANPAAIEAFGGLPAGTSLLFKFRAPEMQGLISSALSGAVGAAPIDYAEKVPVERLYKVAAVPVGEDLRMFVLVFRDQSEVRRIDRMRSDFIANASHELRTPLASISGFIETLRGPARDDDKARENFLQIMQNQTARMARLIDDLLSLSRLEMKPYLKPDETVDVGQLVESVIDSLRHLAEESGVTIERQMPDKPVHVAGNRDELIQVFENLLENACKYGQSGGRVVVSVARQPENREHGIGVSFRDFGPGIAEEHIPRITERFYRVDVDTSRAQKGTGLGLSIVKHILGRHDARLTIRSKPGEGATFTVHLHAR